VIRQFFLACPRRSLCMVLGHTVLVHDSFESFMLLGGAFCVAHCELLNVVARTLLECLSNAINICFRGLCLQEILHATDYL
jgi:hypothetical protein